MAGSKDWDVFSGVGKFRFGKRGNTFRFGKRGNAFRFGKRLPDSWQSDDLGWRELEWLRSILLDHLEYD